MEGWKILIHPLCVTKRSPHGYHFHTERSSWINGKVKIISTFTCCIYCYLYLVAEPRTSSQKVWLLLLNCWSLLHGEKSSSAFAKILLHLLYIREQIITPLASQSLYQFLYESLKLSIAVHSYLFIYFFLLMCIYI